jgi:hypothetical protein
MGFWLVAIFCATLLKSGSVKWGQGKVMVLFLKSPYPHGFDWREQAAGN